MTGFKGSSHVFRTMSFSSPLLCCPLCFHSQVAPAAPDLPASALYSLWKMHASFLATAASLVLHSDVPSCGPLPVPHRGQRMWYSHWPGLNSMLYPRARSWISPTHSTRTKGVGRMVPREVKMDYFMRRDAEHTHSLLLL